MVKALPLGRYRIEPVFAVGDMYREGLNLYSS